MREFKRFAIQLSIVIVVAIASFIGCTDPNYELGNNFLPDGQDMTIGSMEFIGVDESGDRVISTRNYYSYRINSANQTNGMFGAEYNDHFGTRHSGFYSQYTPMYVVPEDDQPFGYDPILDSVILYLAISTYSGDTTTVNKFLVYEVLNDDFLGDYDTTDDDDYYETDSDAIVSEFAKEGVLSDVMFTFKYPDQENGIYINTTYVRFDDITDAGRDFMERLMLQKGDYDYEIYNGDYVDFVEVFKGLYICPSPDNVLDTTNPAGSGATYGTQFASSGFGFYARSKYEEDPTMIKDTVGMTFAFRDDTAIGGGTSINTTVRDYSGKNFSVDDVKTENNLDVLTTGVISVEGMGGIVSEFTFEQNLFKEFESAIEAGGEEFNNIFFNTARITLQNPHATEYGIYTEDTTLDYKLDDMVSRLVFYTYYSTYLDEDEEYLETETALDYSYSSEVSYGTASNIDGYLNRSRGCYTLNIPLQMQDFWNDYVEAKEENGGKEFTQSEWDAMDWNKLYLGPDLGNLYTPRYAILQGQADEENATPIRLEITYTLLKK